MPSAVGYRYNTVQVAMASAERIFEILDAPPEPTGATLPPVEGGGEIEFRELLDQPDAIPEEEELDMERLRLASEDSEALDAGVSRSLEELEPSESSLHKVEHLLKAEHAQMGIASMHQHIRRSAGSGDRKC